jgi:plastocyanin
VFYSNHILNQTNQTAKMLFNKSTLFAAAAVFARVALGQESGDNVKVHVVQVSDASGALKFWPEVLEAKTGELVQFHFYPKNHSIAQSSFADPCMPISESESGNGTTGFFSGFMPVEADSALMPTFTIPITDEKPIWYYCATGPHCQSGMVGVINPPKNNAERTIEKYREAAAGTTTEVPEEEVGGDEGEVEKGAGAPNGTAPGVPNPSGTNLPDSDGAASAMSTSTVSVLIGALAAAFFLA